MDKLWIYGLVLLFVPFVFAGSVDVCTDSEQYCVSGHNTNGFCDAGHWHNGHCDGNHWHNGVFVCDQYGTRCTDSVSGYGTVDADTIGGQSLDDISQTTVVNNIGSGVGVLPASSHLLGYGSTVRCDYAFSDGYLYAPTLSVTASIPMQALGGGGLGGSTNINEISNNTVNVSAHGNMSEAQSQADLEAKNNRIFMAFIVVVFLIVSYVFVRKNRRY